MRMREGCCTFLPRVQTPCAYARYHFSPYTNPAEKCHFAPQPCSSFTSTKLHFQGACGWVWGGHDPWFYWSQRAEWSLLSTGWFLAACLTPRGASHTPLWPLLRPGRQSDRRPFSVPAQVEDTLGHGKPVPVSLAPARTHSPSRKDRLDLELWRPTL